jgi:hypothetical protein
MHARTCSEIALPTTPQAMNDLFLLSQKSTIRSLAIRILEQALPYKISGSTAKTIRFDGKTFFVNLAAYVDLSLVKSDENIAEKIKELILELFGKEVEARCVVETIPTPLTSFVMRAKP